MGPKTFFLDRIDRRILKQNNNSKTLKTRSTSSRRFYRKKKKMSEPVSRSPYHIYHRSHGCQKIIVYPQGSNLRDVRVFVNWNTGIVTVNGKIDSEISHFPMEISLPAGFYDQSSLGFNVFGSEQILINFPFAADGPWVPLRRLVYFFYISFFIYLSISIYFFCIILVDY